jgi:hypothetical protein
VGAVLLPDQAKRNNGNLLLAVDDTQISNAAPKPEDTI